MTIRARDLVPLRDLSDTIKTRAAHLYNNIKLCRVTHTLKSIKLTIKALTDLRFALQTDHEFEKDLRQVLLLSQRGPTEIVMKDGRLFISGSFDTHELRGHLLVNEHDLVIEAKAHVTN